MLYIAYGSNLNKEQMSFRCPTAKVVGKGMVNNYSLVFNTHADIIPDNMGEVPVLVWNINSDKEWETLDKYEGFPRYYVKQNIAVNMEDGSQVTAIAYVMANDRKGFCLPYREYFETIREGYRWQNMDEGYLWNALDYTDRMVEEDE